MKNAVALYLESLAALAAKTGALPKNAASAKALLPLWQDLRAVLSDEIERRSAEAAAAEIAAAADSFKTRRAALADDFDPVSAAVEKLRAKTVVPSSLRSADWSAVPAQIREVSQFSAGIESARVLGAVQERLVADLSMDFSQPSGREAFLRDMRAVMESEGVGWETSGEGSLLNPRANSRLGLIYDQQTRSARGYARRKIDMDPVMLDVAPAQELVRERDSKVKRDWTARWRSAGGIVYGGRLAALKTDPVWTAISRFGVPWPPFDYNSGMGLRDLLRSEAEDLGMLSPNDTVEPDSVPDYSSNVQASVSDIPDDLLPFLRDAFGDKINISNGVVTLNPV